MTSLSYFYFAVFIVVAIAIVYNLFAMHRENKEGITSLRYWDLSSQDDAGLPQHIAYLIQRGVKPNEIAVLGRANAPLNEMAGVLTDNFGIPASRENLPVSQMAATPLVLALLALVASEKDSLAKAQIATLTEQGLKHTFFVSEGGHTWANWRLYLNTFAPLLFK